MAVSAHSKLKREQPTYSGVDLKVFVKDFDQGRKRSLTVKTWSTIKDVKDAIQKLLNVPPAAQRLYFGPLLSAGKALPNHWSLENVGIYRSGETLFLEIKGNGTGGVDGGLPRSSTITTLKKQESDICISKSVLDLTPKNLQRTVQQARRGMLSGPHMIDMEGVNVNTPPRRNLGVEMKMQNTMR